MDTINFKLIDVQDAKETYSATEVASLLQQQLDQDSQDALGSITIERYRTVGDLISVLTHKGRRHHLPPHVIGVLVAWVLSLISVVCTCCKAKCMRKRVEELLTIENRTTFRPLGYVWSINKKMTSLTLTRMGQNFQQPRVIGGAVNVMPPRVMNYQTAPVMVPQAQA